MDHLSDEELKRMSIAAWEDYHKHGFQQAFDAHEVFERELERRQKERENNPIEAFRAKLISQWRIH